ncbi:tail fiber protein [Polaribacter haliotis]|uniref:Tail fiber protein n=1 Tax=Polaribacter haliotis TaxID=1888915 RepID=A0A7L8ABL5_9FLAO|nr:tail fiber protein [Polaribacter haliotis]QOD59390.1 tail fiber protein [Polaribacter haliotis]
MKKFYYTLLLAFLTSISFAQGISVQGIARDNASSAITDTNLTFTFSIVKEDNTVLYAETQGIKTDNFGVFSHIVSSGNPIENTFNDVNFATKNMKLKVSVVYNGNTIEVYDQPFQYTPYAHYAANGVPTGSIMPYTGDTAPSGWVLCDGRDLTAINGSTALIAIVGNNAPDLQGTFLRGTGTSAVNGKAGPALNDTQGDDNKEHAHYLNLNTNTTGNHNHTSYDYYKVTQAVAISGGPATWYLSNSNGHDNQARGTSSNGNHNHNVAGNTYNTGTESRPVNYGVNYIIKL